MQDKIQDIRYFSGAIDPVGCVSNAWNLVKENYWIYFAICLLAWVIISCIPCLNIFLFGPIIAGVYYVMLREMRNEPTEFSMMFKGFERFVPTMVVGLIQSIPGIIGQVIQYTTNIGEEILKRRGADYPDFFQSNGTEVALASGLIFLVIIIFAVFLIFSIAWSITFMFALPLLVENDIGVMEAISLSARAGWSNPGGLILLMILEVLLAILGVLLFCLGVFFMLPIIFAANAFAFRQVFPFFEPMQRRTGPPTPEEYGGSFGRGN